MVLDSQKVSVSKEDAAMQEPKAALTVQNAIDKGYATASSLAAREFWHLKELVSMDSSILTEAQSCMNASLTREKQERPSQDFEPQTTYTALFIPLSTQT